MRKRIIPSTAEAGSPPSGCDWLDLEDLVQVEITSEDPAHPIESALLPGATSGWRAAGPGEQTIRLLFAQPQAVHRIWLEFVEPDVERTQEFVLRWSPDSGQTVHEIVRQQWNFSPHGATGQTEDLQRRPHRRHPPRTEHRARHQRRPRARVTGPAASGLTPGWATHWVTRAWLRGSGTAEPDHPRRRASSPSTTRVTGSPPSR